MKVMIGAPVNSKSAYALPHFLENQKKIQEVETSCRLILATDEDILSHLSLLKDLYGLRGEVITYRTHLPAGASSRIWSIVAGRNAIREYFLKSDADYLFFQDADMVVDPQAPGILYHRALTVGADVVHSGYLTRDTGTYAMAMGCSLFSRRALEEIPFRCMEFAKERVIDEGALHDLDAWGAHLNILKGIFVEVDHYYSPAKSVHTYSREIEGIKRIMTHPHTRSLITRVNILCKRPLDVDLIFLLSRVKRA